MQEYWIGLPSSPPGDLPDPGIKPKCPALQADSLPIEPPGKPLKVSKPLICSQGPDFKSVSNKCSYLLCLQCIIRHEISSQLDIYT